MPQIDIFSHWDLLVLGVVVIVTAIIGFLVYFEKPKSPTHRAFLGFTLWTVVWGTCNYLSYHVRPAMLAFILLRLTVFAVVWETYYFLKFAVVFPGEEKFSPRNMWRVVPGIAAVVAVLTLTPLIFERIASVAADGTIASVVNGPVIPVFGMTSVGFTVAGLVLLIMKTLRAKDAAAKQYYLIGAGALIMFVLIITSNFALPVFLNDTRYLQFGALFVFPFIALTSYSIVKNKMFNVKVVSAQVFVAALLVVSLLELVQAQSLAQIILQAVILASLLGVGILLIRSVHLEVKQREELQRLDKELEDKNRQLEELSLFKTSLLSLASHQMKSPLAAIKGFGSLLLGGQMGTADEKGKETVGKMMRSANDLITLINTLLDLRKVEEGKMDYQFVKVDLREMAREVFELLKPLAEAKKLEFTFDSPEHAVWVNVDEKLKQVIQNLADNAIKYTPSGFVRIELKEASGIATISVSDSGVGFSPELAPHLFEEFVRDERVKKQILGTGLGLFIARKIAEAHGGTISAKSPGADKGSTFRLSLPETA